MCNTVTFKLDYPCPSLIMPNRLVMLWVVLYVLQDVRFPLGYEVQRLEAGVEDERRDGAVKDGSGDDVVRQQNGEGKGLF